MIQRTISIFSLFYFPRSQTVRKNLCEFPCGRHAAETPTFYKIQRSNGRWAKFTNRKNRIPTRRRFVLFIAFIINFPFGLRAKRRLRRSPLLPDEKTYVSTSLLFFSPFTIFFPFLFFFFSFSFFTVPTLLGRVKRRRRVTSRATRDASSVKQRLSPMYFADTKRSGEYGGKSEGKRGRQRGGGEEKIRRS